MINFLMGFLMKAKVGADKKVILEKPINIITSSFFNIAFSIGITSLFEITNNFPAVIIVGILTEIMTLIAYKEEIRMLLK